MSKLRTSPIFQHIRASRFILPICAVIAVIAAGSYLVLHSSAATSILSLEPENGTLSGSASTVTDVAASNGKAIQFAAPDTGCALGEISTPPDCFPAPPGPLGSGKTWQLTFNEEFSGTSLDTTKLTPCFDWNWGACTVSFNKGRERYLPEQVRVNNGTAKLVAEPLSPPYSNTGCLNNSCTYKSGLLSTARPNAGDGSDYLYKFTYGYVESKMKFPGTQGFFTAFWMLPANPDYNYPTEIDIVEILGDDPTTIFMNYHYAGRSRSYTPNDGKYNNGSCAVKDYSKDWVTFGMDWQPTYIAWYINGVKCGQFNGDTTTIEDGPMQIIIDLMVDHGWQQNWNVMLKDTSLVRQMELDYLRVYQQR